MQTVRHFGKIALNLIGAVLVFLLVVFVLPKVLVFFMPFVVGALIAMCASPLVQFLERRMRIRRKAGSAFTIVLAVGLVALILYGVGHLLFEQAAGFIENLPMMWASLSRDFAQAGDRLQVIFNKMPKQIREEWEVLADNISQYAGNLIGNLSSPTVEKVGEFAKNVPGFIVSIVMALLSAYFFVANKEEVQEYYRRYVPQPLKEKWDIVRNSLKKAFGGYLIAQLKIEVWMYLLLFVGLKIAGVNYVSLVALGIAVLDLLPVFGTGTVLVPWAVIKVIGGHYTTAVILITLWGIGQLVRQMIQPKIVGESLGMPAIPTLFLLYIGWEISGVTGMILAVPVGLVFVNLYKEGVFDTTKDSVLILVRDLNAFRKYDKEDYEFYRKIRETSEDKQIGAKQENNRNDGKDDETCR
ncbi:MAG: sporulation integral membrane protein YtvI [Lachnospiraceae bacterium]|nr:sporulation integral membrane protein YtvI [Lachnospiraceae bacterium]